MQSNHIPDGSDSKTTHSCGVYAQAYDSFTMQVVNCSFERLEREFTAQIYTMPSNRISMSDSYDDWCRVIISIVGETQQRSHSYNKQAVRRSTTVTITG